MKFTKDVFIWPPRHLPRPSTVYIVHRGSGDSVQRAHLESPGPRVKQAAEQVEGGQSKTVIRGNVLQEAGEGSGLCCHQEGLCSLLSLLEQEDFAHPLLLLGLWNC